MDVFFLNQRIVIWVHINYKTKATSFIIEHAQCADDKLTMYEINETGKNRNETF